MGIIERSIKYALVPCTCNARYQISMHLNALIRSIWCVHVESVVITNTSKPSMPKFISSILLFWKMKSAKGGFRNQRSNYITERKTDDYGWKYLI